MEENIIVKSGRAEIEVKRSHFICELSNVTSKEDALMFIENIKKKNRDARHNCFAMRIGFDGGIFEKAGDDGEPARTAGKPMLDILSGRNITDVCAVVTRYFGGILLGTGGLQKAYSDALKTALSGSVIKKTKKAHIFTICSEYSKCTEMKYHALANGCFCVNEEYADNVKLDFLVPPEKKAYFIEKIYGISAGNAGIEDRGEVFYFEDEKPVLYKKINLC